MVPGLPDPVAIFAAGSAARIVRQDAQVLYARLASAAGELSGSMWRRKEGRTHNHFDIIVVGGRRG